MFATTAGFLFKCYLSRENGVHFSLWICLGGVRQAVLGSAQFHRGAWRPATTSHGQPALRSRLPSRATRWITVPARWTVRESRGGGLRSARAVLRLIGGSYWSQPCRVVTELAMGDQESASAGLVVSRTTERIRLVNKPRHPR